MGLDFISSKYLLVVLLFLFMLIVHTPVSMKGVNVMQRHGTDVDKHCLFVCLPVCPFVC